MLCNVCESALKSPLFVSPGEVSLTSLCEVVGKEVRVYLCPVCEHVQTAPTQDSSEFYAEDYKISLASEDDDQLYDVVGEEPVFRTQHQARTLLGTMQMPAGSRILDFGSAKASTMRYLLSQRADLDVHLFDVSNMYIEFWKSFRSEDKWSTFEIPDKWLGSFDIVTSFFALEHVEQPAGFLDTIHQLLKPAGVFYCLVPNVLSNTIDFIVADHINHFTERSVHRLFSKGGFRITSIDNTSHRGAMIITAEKRQKTDCIEMDATSFANEIRSIAKHWTETSKKIRKFDSELPAVPNSAIYGSGFYGAFIATSMVDLSKVDCFVDQNPHLQGNRMFGLPIVSPSQLPAKIQYVYVGLNPAISKEAMSQISQWQDRALSFVYL